MHFRFTPVGAAAALGTAMLLSLVGCGGGGGGKGLTTGGLPGGNGGGGGNTPPTSREAGTAKFSVNVETGKVTVTPLGGDPTSRAVFTGSALSFQSSDLLQDSGELTRRKIAVQLTNNTNETLGSASGGFKVRFGAFSLNSTTDLRSLTNVSTHAGSGASSGQVDGPALSTTMSSPHSVLFGNNGDVFFSGYDQSLRVVRNGVVTTLIKNVGPVVGMIWRGGVQNDVIYGASLNTHRIYKFDLSTKTATLIGGTGSVGGDDGPGSVARFNLPYAIADIPNTDPTNPDLLVSEGTTGKLRRLTWTGSEYNVSTLPFTNDAPRGMVRLGNTGRFAVSEAFLRRITLFDLSGNKVSLGDGVDGQDNGDGTAMSFYEPIGLCYDDASKTIFVSESAGVIRQLTLDPGGNITFREDWKSAHIAGVYQAFNFQDGTGDQARFLGPVGMAFDPRGDLYVADSGNQRIRKITATNGRFPISGGTNTGTELPRLANPSDFVPTDAGTMPYILENQTVERREATNLTPWELIVPAGVKTFEFIVTVEAQTDSAAPPDAVFNPGPSPAPGSSRAQVRTLAGRVNEGYVNGTMAGSAFDSPTAFAYDAQGNLFVADTDNRSIRRITPSGQVTTVAGVQGNIGSADGLGSTASFGLITGVAVASSGEEIFIADSTNNKVRRIALVGGDPGQPSSWKVTSVAGVIGAGAYANGLGGSARFNKPYGIALGAGGDLIVSEAAGNRIRRISPVGENRDLPASWTVSLLAGSETSVAGNGDGFKGAASFSEPRGLAISASGEVYVADFGNHRIRRVDPTGTVTSFAGSTNGYGDNDTGTSAQFNGPTDVAVDRAGYVYVSDAGNFLLRRISPSGAVRTVAGAGVTGTPDGAGNVARFQTLNGVEVTTGGDVVLGDGNRIRLVQRLISQAAL
ncbi:MAG: hypothetical protein ACO1SV_06725 [Fimbriimonas sp.]